MKRWAGVAGAILGGILTTGCVAVVAGGAVGAGGYAYVAGELKATENASMDRVWSATQKAVADLKFFPTSTAKDELEAKLEARTGTDRSVTLRLKSLADGATEVRVRVDTFGNKEISERILERIRAGLQ